TVRMGHWMPLNWLSFGLDYVVWGMNPLGYHLTNVALHAAAAAVLYVVAKRVLRVALSARPLGDGWLRAGALVAALAFGLHPLRVEWVAWITERRAALSGFFSLLTIWAYLRYVGRRSRGAYWASVGCFALALMSKSITASLPAVLLLLDVYPLGRLGGHAGWLTREALRVWRGEHPFFVLPGGGRGRGVLGPARGGGADAAPHPRLRCPRRALALCPRLLSRKDALARASLAALRAGAARPTAGGALRAGRARRGRGHRDRAPLPAALARAPRRLARLRPDPPSRAGRRPQRLSARRRPLYVPGEPGPGSALGRARDEVGTACPRRGVAWAHGARRPQLDADSSVAE